jgi:hypothetical protein
VRRPSADRRRPEPYQRPAQQRPPRAEAVSAPAPAPAAAAVPIPAFPDPSWFVQQPSFFPGFGTPFPVSHAEAKPQPVFQFFFGGH